MNELIAVFIGGGLGSVCRYSISRWLGDVGYGFPIGTLTANALSCVVLGLAWGYVSPRLDISQAYKVLIMVGFCGGFSTFSTYSLETLTLIQNGAYITAALYVLTSLVICLAILFLTIKWVS